MNLRRALRNNLKFFNQGVTMIELMMVIAIISLLTVVSVSSYRNWQQHVLLLNTADELKSSLHLVQGQAIAASGNTNWGVHLATDHYIIFSGSFYEENNPSNQRRDFSGIEIINLSTAIADGAGAYSQDLVFNKYTGNTVNIGTIILAPASNHNKTKSIDIDVNGQVQ